MDRSLPATVNTYFTPSFVSVFPWLRVTWYSRSVTQLCLALLYVDGDAGIVQILIEMLRTQTRRLANTCFLNMIVKGLFCLLYICWCTHVLYSVWWH